MNETEDMIDNHERLVTFMWDMIEDIKIIGPMACVNAFSKILVWTYEENPEIAMHVLNYIRWVENELIDIRR